MKKVSVVIPTYKRSNMLNRAIESVLKQTYKNIEIIVIDDNNPDTEYRKKTSLEMEKYKDNPNIKYIKHNRNKNGSVARNTGIYHSTGELITFLDDDDWYHPEKIEKQVEFLVKNKKYKAVYCGWNRGGKQVEPTLEGDLSSEILSGEKVIRTNTIMIWKSVINEIGGWREDFIRNQEAALLLDYFYKGYQIGVISKVLVYYDISDRSNALLTKKNKEQYDFLISEFDHVIKALERENKFVRKEIITSRYKAILLSYMKEKQFINAIRHYLNSTIKYPVFFNKQLLNYILKKVKED